MTNREILFIVKLRNDARQAISGLTGDLRRVAKAAGTAAAGHNQHSKALSQVTQQAQQAAAAMQQVNRAAGGAVNPANRANRAMGGWAGTMRNLAGGLAAFAASYLGFQAAFGGVGWIIEQGGAWQMMNARIQLVTKSVEEANYVQEELYRLSQENTANIEGSVALFYRTARAVQDYGYSLQDVLDITSTVQQAMIVSGATTTEATGAMIQFSQALASNRLGGEEFRSVMENAPRLAQAILDGIDQTADPKIVEKYGLLIEKKVGDMTVKQRKLLAGSLRAMAIDGLLTTDTVAKAVLASQKKINEEFLKLPMTASRAATALTNALKRESGEIDKSLNLNGGIGTAILFLANEVVPRLSDALEPVGTLFEVIGAAAGAAGNLFRQLGIDGEQAGEIVTILVKGISSLILVFGGFRAVTGSFSMIVTGLRAIGIPLPTLSGLFSGFMRVATGAITAVQRGIPGLVLAVRGGMAAITAAIAANPFGALLAAIGVVIAAYMTFRNETIAIAAEFKNLNKEQQAEFDKTGKVSISVGAIVAEAWERLQQVAMNVYARIAKALAPLLKALSEGWSIFTNWLGEMWVELVKLWDEAMVGLQSISETYIKPIFEMIGGIPRWFASVIRSVFNALASFFEGAVNMAADAADALDVFDKGWAASMRAFSATGGAAIRDIGGDMAGFMENFPKLAKVAGTAIGSNMLDGIKTSLLLNPGTSLLALQGSILDEFMSVFGDGTFFSDAAERTAAEKGDQGKIDLEEDNGARLVNEPEKAKGNKDRAKKAKDREDRIKEAVQALKSLTSAYNPYLDALAQDQEAKENLMKLELLRLTNSAEFTEALGRQGMMLEDYNMLQWQVSNGLRVDAAREFFRTYVEGYETLNPLTTEAVKKQEQFVQSFLSAQETGGEFFQQFLEQAGVTLPQAQAAVEAWTKNLDPSVIETYRGAIENLTGTYLGFAGALSETAREQRQINELELMRKQNLPAFEEALKKLGLTMEQYNLALERQKIILAGQEGGFAAARSAAQQYAIDLEDSGLKAADAWGNAFRGMEDSLTSFVSTGKLNFKGLVDSIIADIARLLVQQTLMKTVTSVFGLPIGHSGGLAGANGSSVRGVNPAVFAGARRFHVGGLAKPGGGSGLRAQEVPVIAKKNEALLPTARLPDGNFGVKALIPEDMRRGMGGGSPIVISPTINNTINGGNGDPEELGGQISRQTVLALEALVKRVMGDEMRSGGLLSGA